MPRQDDFFQCIHLAAGTGFAAVNCLERMGKGGAVRTLLAQQTLDPRTDNQATFTTEDGFTLTVGGFRMTRNFAGPGFLCNFDQSCQSKMKLTVSGLTAGSEYKWTYWGYQGAANANPPGNYEMFVDGTSIGKGEFMQCAEMSPGACDPQQSGRNIAGGAGEMLFTWSGLNGGGHIDLSAFEIVEVAEPGTEVAAQPEYPPDNCDYDRNPEGCFVPPPGGEEPPPPGGDKGPPPPKGR